MNILSCNHDTLGGLFMELDLGNNAYDILNDWHPNAAKEELTAQLTKQVLVEKEQLPKLLSREDLKERWR